MKKIKILELFAGIGACSTALKRIGMDIEIVDAVEIDKYAIASFNAIHRTNFEVQDIIEYNKVFEDLDLITHGSPCQDFSIAGKQAGGDLGSGTRSSLMYETIRIVGQNRPKYVLWENVKNLLSAKHKHNFDKYIETMNTLGYNSYYQVLNAKDYGIPQNRERVYTISIRKDIDKGNFVFPQKEKLKLRLKDMLEDEVDEKYYINDGTLNNIFSNNQAGFLSGGKWDKINESCRRYYKEDGISPSIHTCQGGNTEPKIMMHIIPQPVKVRKYPVNIPLLQNYLRNRKHNLGMSNKDIAEKLEVPITTVEHWFRKDSCFSIPEPDIWYKLKETLCFNLDIFDESIMTFEEREGVFEKADRVYDEKGLAPTLTQQQEKIKENYRIRKLTPKECWRLMGFSDEDFEKAANIPTSNTQLYKQAGNSIVVNVLEKIFKNLLLGEI